MKLPATSTPLFWNAIVAARFTLNVLLPKRGVNVLPAEGRELKYHALSESETPGMAPSPSNDSMYACPAAFGCGLLMANSPCRLTRDGVLLCLNGSFASARVSSGASHARLPVMPATREPTGSKPRGGRLKPERWLCEMAVNASWPFSSGNCDANPRMVVGAAANSGFSS